TRRLAGPDGGRLRAISSSWAPSSVLRRRRYVTKAVAGSNGGEQRTDARAGGVKPVGQRAERLPVEGIGHAADRHVVEGLDQAWSERRVVPQDGGEAHEALKRRLVELSGVVDRETVVRLAVGPDRVEVLEAQTHGIGVGVAARARRILGVRFE